MRKNLSQLAGLDQRNIGWNDKGVVDATGYADLRSHLDGSGFAGICGVGNDFKAVLLCEFQRERVAGHERAAWAGWPGGERGHNVMEHGLRQLGASGLIE